MFYCLDMYIFYISNNKLGTCLTVLKDYRKGICVTRVIMWGLFCLSGYRYLENYAEAFFFFARQFPLVFMYLMCSPKKLFFQCGPEMPKLWTPCCRQCKRILLPRIIVLENTICFISHVKHFAYIPSNCYNTPLR